MVARSKIVKEILLILLAALFTFYSTFYIAAALLHGILRLDDFDGTIPFHYQSYDKIFTNSTRWNDPVFLGDFISLELTYLAVPFALITFLRHNLWDYAVTVTFIHCLVVCAVNLAFPFVWEWWVCILIGLLAMVGIGEISNGLIRKKVTGSFKQQGKCDGKVT
ncbi:putative transmembrane protein 244 [Diadema setosum]|uniref:putative transmembrane protein 244 n=1 Tax=Diadema setosum TaxID=31175 RepID=UPI003B3BD3BE